MLSWELDGVQCNTGNVLRQVSAILLGPRRVGNRHAIIRKSENYQDIYAVKVYKKKSISFPKEIDRNLNLNLIL